MSKNCPTCGGTGKIETPKVVRDNSPKWQLFERKHFVKNDKGKEFLFQTEYAIISPEGVCTWHRIIAPLGNLEFKCIYEAMTKDGGEIWFWDFEGQKLDFIKQYEGWKKSSRRAASAKTEEENQEYLSRGYLPYH